MKQLTLSVLNLPLLVLSFLMITGEICAQEAATGAPPAHANGSSTAKPTLQIKAVASGLQNPTDIESHDGTTYVSLQKGHIVKINEEKASAEDTIVDFESEVLSSDVNRGLLSFVFDPNYAESGRIFVHYTANAGGVETRVSMIKMPADGTLGTAEHERKMLRLLEPTPRHLGGRIVFGPDGKLYIGLGDGGENGDPRDRAQKVADLMGSILRIEPTPFGGKLYTSPMDNPASVNKAWNPDIWTVGMRNPSGLTFDSTGNLYAADTGIGERQEVDLIVKGGNYGWSTFDGDVCRKMKFDCMDQKFKEPIASYSKDKISNLILGPVYNGKAIPGLVGTLLIADRPTGKVYGLKIQEGKLVSEELLLSTGKEISTFGVDKNGEVLFADFKGGEIYRIVSQ